MPLMETVALRSFTVSLRFCQLVMFAPRPERSWVLPLRKLSPNWAKDSLEQPFGRFWKYMKLRWQKISVMRKGQPALLLLFTFILQFRVKSSLLYWMVSGKQTHMNALYFAISGLEGVM